MKIVDDDIDVKALALDNSEITVDDLIGENDPTVAGVIDERPEHVQILEKYRDDNRWKALSSECLYIDDMAISLQITIIC